MKLNKKILALLFLNINLINGAASLENTEPVSNVSGIQFLIAFKEGKLDLINNLIKLKNAEELAQTITPDGNTILHFAAMSNNAEAVSIALKLIYRSAKVNICNQTKYGVTALHIAALKDNPAIINILISAYERLKASSQINIDFLNLTRNDDDATALIIAVKAKKNKAVEELVSKMGRNATGRYIPLVNINAKDKHGKTALDYAQSSNNWPLIKLLLENNAEQQATSEEPENKSLPIFKFLDLIKEYSGHTTQNNQKIESPKQKEKSFGEIILDLMKDNWQESEQIICSKAITYLQKLKSNCELELDDDGQLLKAVLIAANPELPQEILFAQALESLNNLAKKYEKKKTKVTVNLTTLRKLAALYPAMPEKELISLACI